MLGVGIKVTVSHIQNVALASPKKLTKNIYMYMVYMYMHIHILMCILFHI